MVTGQSGWSASCWRDAMRGPDFCGWLYDVAREQSPTEAGLSALLERSLAAGYNAVGLYLEHRFAYPSLPWSSEPGSLQPGLVRAMSRRFRPRGLRVIPFLNTLGHMEGFIRMPEGRRLAEEPHAANAEGPADPLFRAPRSEQICPSRRECREFVRKLVADAIAAFDDEWVHLGGDETRQLGRCPLCADRAVEIGVAGIYGTHMGELCRQVLAAGRRPCLWGDMLLKHPEALDHLPPDTMIFDWQYESRPAATTRRLRSRGFDVVCCPSVQTYNSGWCFLEATQRNIDEHAADAREADALGILVTTWEQSFFCSYGSILPVILAAGRRLATGMDWSDALGREGGPGYAEAAAILGNQVPEVSEFLRPGGWRTLRDRLIFRGSPFHLWRDWRGEACGPVGDHIRTLCDEADRCLAAATSPEAVALRFAIGLHRGALRWVRAVESAWREFDDGSDDGGAATLRNSAVILEGLRPGLILAAGQGGSAADVQRLDRLLVDVRDAADRMQSPPTDPRTLAMFESRLIPGIHSTRPD